MTDRDDRQHTDTCGGDVAAYALGSLSPVEAAAFEAHLAECAVCAAELASFQHVVDAMSLSGERHRAPRAVKRQVMRVVNEEAHARYPRRADSTTRRRPSFAQRPAWAAAGLLAAAAIAFGSVELAGPGGTAMHIYQAQVTGHGSAQLRVSGDRAELTVQHFAVPSKGHTYEVWLLKRGSAAPVPARALFNVSSSGNGHVRLPEDVRDGDEFLVTKEQAGGSPSGKPTTSPIMSVKLT